MGATVPIFLMLTGIFYLFKLKGFYLLHPVKTLLPALKRQGSEGISPIKALCMALAGTLGVGNIVGVATALYLGGAGAVFWMIFSALIAMVLKYAEIVLAVRHRRRESNGCFSGGAPFYIEDGLAARGLPRFGRICGCIFACLCFVNALTMGSMLQTNAVASALNHSFGIPAWVVGGVMAILCGLSVKGGVRRIASVTEKLVPLMTVGFLILCLAVLCLRYQRIPAAVSMIFRDAFSPASMGGGFLGFLTSNGVRYGVMRGLVSNEAGCGTAPMAHASADVRSPAAQGVLGLVEVFVDTVLLCTVTALTLLVSDSGSAVFGEDGVRTAAAAFASILGDWSGYVFAVAVFFFGFATVLCWGHYGKTSLSAALGARFRSQGGAEVVFCVVYAASVLCGALISPKAVWYLADSALAGMTICNLPVLLLMQNEVLHETKSYFSAHIQNKKRIEWKENKPHRKDGFSG